MYSGDGLRALPAGFFWTTMDLSGGSYWGGEGVGFAEGTRPRVSSSDARGRAPVIVTGAFFSRTSNRAGGKCSDAKPCVDTNHFSARLHILDDLIYIITLVNNDLGYSKTGQISRNTQFGV